VLSVVFRCRYVVPVAAGACFLALALPSAAAPTKVTLTLVGAHPLGKEFHEGTFNASAPLCPSGDWAGNGGGRRTFTCADGTGTFMVSFDGNLEHTQGSTGPWQILGGSGPNATLRGLGTAHVDSSVTDGTGAVNFSETWTGIVDFDATAPSGSITVTKLTRPGRPTGRWKARVTLAARDNIDGNPVAYQFSASAGKAIVQREGSIGGGAVTLSFSFSRAPKTHVLQISVQLADPLQNSTTITKSVKLR
jgi:hypothetical protein